MADTLTEKLIETGLTPDQATAAVADGKLPWPKVAIAYVHDNAGRVTSFEESLLGMLTYDMANLNLIADRITVRYGTDGLVAARNTIAARFIQSDSEWLLWMDTDMGFQADALYRLLEAADPVERPIVGALCFVNRENTHDGYNGYRAKPLPTIYRWRNDTESGGPAGFVAVPMYPVNTVMRVDATGAAFVLIHRSAFERIAESVIPGRNEQVGPHWYDRSYDGAGNLMGEDISFCVRALFNRIPIHVHTGVRTTHFKEIWLSEVDHWRQYVPPPATERVAVVVPTLGRPEHAEPFMRSLRASTGLAQAYAVIDMLGDDTDEVTRAWLDTGAEVVPFNNVSLGRPGSFAEKVNAAYRQTWQPWLFAVGSDVRFHPAWLDHAEHVADVLKGDVIGTNDLGNPRTLAGEHSPHLLIRRSYVDEVGASWDGPKVVCHEGYKHNFVDDEMVVAAKRRGVWQMALGSVVEHLHPLFQKAEDDEVYQLGESHWEHDRELFKQRLEANT